MQIVGNTLFIFNNHDGIRTVDITNVSSAQFLDQFTESMSPAGLSLEGARAIIADDNDVLHMIDLGQELEIAETSRIYNYNGYDANIKNNKVHVSLNSDVITLDITNSENPIELDTDSVSGSYTTVWNIKVINEQLYAMTSIGVITVFDITENGLAEVYSVDLGAHPDFNSYRLAGSVARKGDYLFATTQFESLTVIDVTDENNPSVIERYDWLGYEDMDQDIEVYGERAFIATDSGLMIVDISDPLNPELVEITTQFGFTNTIEKIDDRYALVGSSSSVFFD